MRLRGEDENFAGDVTDPCDNLAFGRTNDYTAVIYFPEQYSDTAVLSSFQNNPMNPAKIDAYLNIIANNWGVILSRVDGVSRIEIPVEGMLVFDTSDNTFKICTQGGLSPTWRVLGNP